MLNNRNKIMFALYEEGEEEKAENGEKSGAHSAILRVDVGLFFTLANRFKSIRFIYGFMVRQMFATYKTKEQNDISIDFFVFYSSYFFNEKSLIAKVV